MFQASETSWVLKPLFSFAMLTEYMAYLVITGWWFGTFFIFHIFRIIIPIDFHIHIFQRGRYTTRQIIPSPGSSQTPHKNHGFSVGIFLQSIQDGYHLGTVNDSSRPKLSLTSRSSPGNHWLIREIISRWLRRVSSRHALSN